MSRKKASKIYDPYKDVVSNLEDVSACIAKADRSSAACVEGILKATMAIEDTVMDPDLHSVALVKKAELVFIANKQKHNLEGLPGDKRLYSLDKCIADCDKVLSDSTGNTEDNPVYEKARELHYKTWKLKEDLLKERDDRNNAPRHQNRFNPLKTSFKNVEMINPSLLQEVVDCYRRSRIVCRLCYFKKRNLEPISSHVCRGSKKNPPKLLIIPASKMCDNIAGTNEVPILSAPKFLLTPGNRHKPFQICKNTDHQFCENKAAVGENRFAHSIEELVVWTIERHYSCSFTEYTERYHRLRDHVAVQSSPDPVDYDDPDTDDLFSDTYSEEDVDRDAGDFEYHPEDEDIVYGSVSDIPRNLLLSIIEKYRKMREYCKWCYYRNNEQGTATRDHQSDVYICSLCKYQWCPVKVIPSSELCWNFGDFEFLPVAPWPNGKPKKDPFEYCMKKDHFRCFRVYVDSEFWYPHSVEEMVIWTVEREYRKSFKDYIQSLGHHPATRRNDHHTDINHEKPSILSQNQNHVPSHSIGSVASRKDDPRSIEVARATSANTSNKKVLLETPSMEGRTNAIQGPLHKTLEPNQPSSSYVGSGLKAASSEHGTSAIKQGSAKPLVTSQSANGVNMHAITAAQAPGNASMPGISANNGAGSNPTQMQFPYQMYHSGGPRPPMMFPSGMRPPMVPFRPPLDGGHQQNLPQHQAAPHLYGVHPGSFYNALFWQQQQQASAAAAAGLKSVTIGGYPSAQEPNSKEGEAKIVGAPMITSSIEEKNSGSVVEPKKASSGSNASIIGDSKSRNKTTLPISSGRKNYTVAGQSEKKKVSAGVGGSGGSKKDGGGDDSGLGEMGSSSMNSSNTSGTGLVLHTSAGAPRLSTKVVEAGSKVFKFSEVNFKDIDDVPIALIKSVAMNFRRKKCVCRACFFGERDLCEKDTGEMCSSGEHKWIKPIVVIPGCTRCDNEPSFQQGEHIPIFPLPPLATLRKCPNTNHHKCFTKALEKQLFQAHSVEELVVWLVESENECSMEDYAKELNIDAYIGGVSSPSLSLGSSLTSDPRSPLLQTSSLTLPPGATLVNSLAPLSPGAQHVDQKPTLGFSEPPKITDMSSIAVENIHPTGWNPMVQPPFQMRPLQSQPPIQPQIHPSRQPQSHPPIQSQPQPPIQLKPRSPQPQFPEYQERTEKSPVRPLTKYSPKDVDFGCLDDIPAHLLSSIAECFKQMKHVCRVCFFTSNCTNRVSKNEKKNMCKKGHQPFKSIRVIPKSYLCVNKTAYISILPLPKHMKTSRNQFEICKKPDHSVCYALSRDTNPWFPHTVEEIVVWIVERETGQLFESTNTRYLIPKNRSQLDADVSKAHVATPNTTPTKPAAGSAEITNHSSMTTNSKGKSAGSAASDMVFSTDDDLMASNSQPFDNVAPLNPLLKTTIDSRVSPAAFYMHSQQPLMGPPPPGYVPFFPSQAVPSMFPSFPYQGAGIGTSGSGLLPPHPIAASTEGQWRAEALANDNRTTLSESASGNFSSRTGNGVVSVSGGKSAARSTIWHDEDPLPESSMWSRAVGDKAELSMTPLRSLSPSLMDSKDVDDIVHQSQVDDDSFQPYATIQPPPIISALAERSSARKFPDTSEVEDSVMNLAQARETFKASSSGISTSGVGAMFGAFHGEQGVMGGGNFLASAMAASVNSMDFPTAGGTLRMSGSPQEDDIYQSGSNSPEDVIDPPLAPPASAAQFLFRCQLCHRRFQTSEELKSHGSSDLSHLELCLLDSGCDEVWHYSPPPPQRAQQMKVCSVSNCVGASHCNKPHSQEQLEEWRARFKHREQRKRTGAHLLGQVSPHLDNQRNSVPISNIPGFFVTVSDANLEPNNGYSWTVHIQGQQWLNLFGITINTSSQWSFKITHVEGAANSGVFHPHSPMWRAPLMHQHRVKQCLMLGSVQITIKALPPGSASRNWRQNDAEDGDDVSACVYLDLGYGQCYTVIVPSISATDNTVSEDQQPTYQLNQQQQNQTVAATGLQFDKLKFSPSPTHSWTIDSDFSDELGDLNIEGEDLTLQHVPIEEWGCSLTD